MIPALAARDPKGAYLFYDCQTDDVRLVLTILGEAERFGAVMANRVDVTSLLEEHGKAAGVNCVDAETGDAIEIRAENVINATGVWADRIKPEEILRDRGATDRAESRNPRDAAARRPAAQRRRLHRPRRLRAARSSSCPGTAAS